MVWEVLQPAAVLVSDVPLGHGAGLHWGVAARGSLVWGGGGGALQAEARQGVATLSLLMCPLQPEGQGTCDGPGEVPSGTHSLLLRAPRCCPSALWKWAAGIPPGPPGNQ